MLTDRDAKNIYERKAMHSSRMRLDVHPRKCSTYLSQESWTHKYRGMKGQLDLEIAIDENVRDIIVQVARGRQITVYPRYEDLNAYNRDADSERLERLLFFSIIIKVTLKMLKNLRNKKTAVQQLPRIYTGRSRFESYHVRHKWSL